MRRSSLHHRARHQSHHKDRDNLPLHSDYNNKRRGKASEKKGLTSSRFIPGVCLFLFGRLLRPSLSPGAAFERHHPTMAHFDQDVNAQFFRTSSLIVRRNLVVTPKDSRQEEWFHPIQYENEEEEEEEKPVEDTGYDNDSESVSDDDDESNPTFSESDEDDTGSPQRIESQCAFDEPPPKHNLGACNPVHEINMIPQQDYFVFVHAGGQRDVFRLTDPTDESDFALKTSRYERNFEPGRYESATLDAMVMERLSSSPYVANIFASCGTAQVMEYSHAGNLHTLIQQTRRAQMENLSSLDKLRISYQIATGLADIQDVSGVSHNDICCHQYIHVDGVYKLNDFHQAIYMKRDKESHGGNFCPIDPVYNDEQLKMYPPELVLNSTKLDLSKVDVYMMTNTMYFLLTNKWAYEGYTQKETIQLLRQGTFMEIPNEYIESQDPAIVAMIKAIRAGWNHDASKRATAREMSDLLANALKEIEGTEDLAVVRVARPPLPKDYRYSSSDFWEDLELE